MLSARATEETARRRPTQTRPRVIDGSRPSLEVDKLMAAMAALEGYVESYLLALEEPESGAAVADEALDVRLGSL